MLFQSGSIELRTTQGHPVKVHLISTGGVIVKTRFQRASMTGLLAKISFMLDRKYTDWLPIWVMVIEHPEGIFVIDTGENSDINDPAYFNFTSPMVRWFNTTQYKFKVERVEVIDRQLQALGIPIGKIKTVVLTHLHLDHVDGLRHFPNTHIIVNKSEWERPFGDLPGLYPSWFKPDLVDLSNTYDVFDKALYLTRNKDLVLVETPGHTWHHCSVILKTEQCHIFFGADICYTQQQIIDGEFSGANASHKSSKQTYSRVRSFCKSQNTIYIPSHEAVAVDRLKHLEFMNI